MLVKIVSVCSKYGKFSLLWAGGWGEVLNVSIFDHAVLFVDQYLELTTSLPDNHNIYGLGEHVTPNLKLR